MFPSLTKGWIFGKRWRITNQKLKSEGLYITHVFDEKQIVLHSTWFNSKLEIGIKDINNLIIFVPSPLDLILTKMMRIDPLDREDIRLIYEKNES